MKASNEKMDARRFSDIRPRRIGKFDWIKNIFGRRSRTVNLKPPFYKRYPLMALIVVLFVAVAAFTAKKLLTRAEVADFYPSACLGSWAGIQNAQGKPEMLGAAGPATEDASRRGASSTVFNADNSAVLSSNDGQIFCGGFVPADYPAEGEIKNVGLTFVWQIGEPSATSTFPQAAVEIISTSTINEPPATSSPPAAMSTSSFLNEFKNFAFNVALAESESDPAVVNEATIPPATTSPPEPASTLTPETANETTTPTGTEQQTTIIGEPLQAALSPISTSTEESSALVASPPPVISPPPTPAPDNNFLKISYSVNGREWVEIAKVNSENWQNFTITAPLRSWQDVRNFQVQIERIPTSLNPAPKVHLDGMFMEVHYEIPPAFAGIIGGGGGASDMGANSNPVGVPAGTPVIILPPSQKPTPVNQKDTFRADEAPQFNFDLNSLPPPAPETAPSSTSETSPTSSASAE